MPTNRRPVSVADSETDPFLFGREPRPFVWGYYNGETFEHFRTTDEFVEFMQCREEICYMHNGGKFDFFYLADYLEAFDKLTVINGRIVKFKIGDCEFRDSFAILPVPLAAHEKTEIDYAIFEAEERNAPDNWKKIIDYLYDDCHSLYTLVTRYIEEFGVNLTTASGALKTWAKMADVEIPNSSQAFYEEFKPFYYGGRVQCFQKGIIDGAFSVADINSAYPTAMTHRHPYGTQFVESDSLPADREKLRRAFIHMRAKSTGALPSRNEDGALYFPDDGELRDFHVTGWEFDAARDTGALELHEVYSVYEFLETVEFNQYVDRFYSEKARCKELGDTAGYLLAKLMQNGLYGKFGANPENYEEWILADPADVEAMNQIYGYAPAELFGPNVICSRPLPEEKHRYYNVAVAASITGWVRAYMWRSICQCDGVLYCDTDSIAARGIGGLPIGKKLGEWEIEAECDYGGIGGKKLYAFRKTDGTWKTASKGVKLDADEIMQVCAGKAVNYQNPAPSFSLKTGTRFIDRTVKMT